MHCRRTDDKCRFYQANVSYINEERRASCSVTPLELGFLALPESDRPTRPDDHRTPTIPRREVSPLADVYTTPCVVDLGDFVEQTGEFIGPHTEAILPLEDHSKE